MSNAPWPADRFATPEPRATCARCGRPEVVCYCAHVTTIEPRTNVLIVQHPRERDVPINTARIARLCLPRATVVQGVCLDDDPAVKAALDDPSRMAIVLFPAGEGVRDLATEAPQGDVTLVVVDGTWWQASKLLKRSPRVAALPRYAIAPSAPSRYRIRREPSDECLSTIEALANALAALESDASIPDVMLRPFDAMVEAQLAYVRGATGANRHGRTNKAGVAPAVNRKPWVAPVLLEENTILFYGEANAWPYGTPGASKHELVHVAAERMRDGERFSAVIAPRNALCPSTLTHASVDEATLRAGESFASFHERWRAFCGEGATVFEWGTYAGDLLEREGGAMPARVDIKPLCARFLRKSPGGLDSCAAAFGPEAPWTFGRAGRRIVALRAIVEAMKKGR